MTKLTNEQRLEALEYLRNNLEAYCAHSMKILPKAGGKPVPFIWNKAQQYIHARLEEQRARLGYVRALILKGRQQGCCLAPETLVLTADLRWVRIDSLQPGQQLVATDEETSSKTPGTPGAGRGRKMRTATVEAVVRTRQPSYRVTLDDGRKLVTSGKHRWLVRKSQTQWLWRCIDDERGDGRSGIKVGDKMRSITRPWGERTMDDAWLGGVIDGEGSLDIRGTGVSLAISQRANGVLLRMDDLCAKRGYGHYIVSDDGPRKTKLGQDPVHAITLSNLGTMFEVMGRARPERFIDKHWWDGKSMPDGGERTIVSIEPLGEIDVVDIQTSTGTFIAEGIVSHNSTYVGARYYHRTSMNHGEGAFIVTHEEKATQSLFKMVKRYHEHNTLAPSTKASNAQELIFGALDSGYKLATAGSQDVGRGNTARLLHGSEFGFWANAQTHLAGLGNTIPSGEEAKGSEIILESTGNGLGNAFHLMWQEAEAGNGEYIAIFVPWFWQDEYRTEPKPDFELNDADRKYMEAYGLDMAQMQWRANKIAEYGKGFAWLFDQEYPATAALAFQTSTQNPLINPSDVMAAVNSKFIDMSGPIVLGCDPAEEGEDRTAIVWRQGRVVFRVEYHPKMRPMQVAGILAKYWAEGVPREDGGRFAGLLPDGMLIDRIGIGAGVVDRLRELNVPHIGVHSGERADAPDVYENKRAEMWWRMKEFFEDQPCRMLNNASLIADITAPQPEVTSMSRKLLESKKKMKKRGVRSPDGGDALAMTFAYPVAPRSRNIDEYGDTGTSRYQPASTAGY